MRSVCVAALIVRCCVQTSTSDDRDHLHPPQTRNQSPTRSTLKAFQTLQSFLAAEAITAYVESEEWQLGEIHAGLAELDAGAATVDHEKVAKWLNSWGKPGETKAPR